jgi:hypothetical protein
MHCLNAVFKYIIGLLAHAYLYHLSCSLLLLGFTFNSCSIFVLGPTQPPTNG